ncbi:MAG: SPOR domain-containing protein [Rhodospirillales bacterium]
MKILFLVLLLANLGFYAYAQGYISPAQETADETLLQPLNPDRIRLLNAAQVAALPKLKPPPRMASCLEWGSFSVADATKADQALQSLTLGERLTQRKVEDSASWWVYLPPQGSKANADKKLGELKRLGIEDYFVVQDEGKFHFAVSLGVFSSKDAALKHLDTLRGKGVRTALAAERAGAQAKVFLQIRDGGDAAGRARQRDQGQLSGNRSQGLRRVRRQTQLRRG